MAHALTTVLLQLSVVALIVVVCKKISSFIPGGGGGAQGMRLHHSHIIQTSTKMGAVVHVLLFKTTPLRADLELKKTTER